MINSKFPVNLVTYTEEIRNKNIYFLCSNVYLFLTQLYQCPYLFQCVPVLFLVLENIKKWKH